MNAPLLLRTALMLAAGPWLAASEGPAGVKWHPGHYVYVDHGAVTPEVLSLPNFRGVQKAVTWRTLEPEFGRYDFSSLRADLALARKHGRQLVVQLTYKSFQKDARNVPDYLTGPAYGGGVYRTLKGGYNPVLWNRQVGERFEALVAALGREFDADPNLEAVNLPETALNAKLDVEPQPGVEAYTDDGYAASLERHMLALRKAFPRTVVIQYTNFPTKQLDRLTAFEQAQGIGLGGPDVYPLEDAVSDPQRGVYRFYARLAGIVPLGAAVQRSNYRIADKLRAALSRGQTRWNGKEIVITADDEKLIPVRLHLKLAREQLRLNYVFWSPDPAEAFEQVKQLLADPELARDPAGGLEAALPARAFVRNPE